MYVISDYEWSRVRVVKGPCARAIFVLPKYGRAGRDEREGGQADRSTARDPEKRVRERAEKREAGCPCLTACRRRVSCARHSGQPSRPMARSYTLLQPEMLYCRPMGMSRRLSIFSCGPRPSFIYLFPQYVVLWKPIRLSHQHKLECRPRYVISQLQSPHQVRL